MGKSFWLGLDKTVEALAASEDPEGFIPLDHFRRIGYLLPVLLIDDIKAATRHLATSDLSLYLHEIGILDTGVAD